MLFTHIWSFHHSSDKKVIEGFRIPRESLKFVIDYCVYDRRQEIRNFSFLSIISFNMIEYIFSNSDLMVTKQKKSFFALMQNHTHDYVPFAFSIHGWGCALSNCNIQEIIAIQNNYGRCKLTD